MKKFGTFQGVFVPSFEAILGAVLFLILPMLVGALGLTNMIILVILANTITLATSFSIADCTTNLESIGPGGMYAISKRSLGRAFGGSIGIQLFIAQAASIGFYCIAFAEPIQPLLIQIPLLQNLFQSLNITSPAMQIQVIASMITFLAFTFAVIGADFIVKIQMLIFIIMIISIGTIFASPFLNLTKEGTNVFTPTPQFAVIPSRFMALGGFWVAFTLFFPAVTGIDAGVGMSGNLKNPRKSLGKGTFIAIGVTTVIYLAITIVFSFIHPDLLDKIGNKNPSIINILKASPVVYFLLLCGILFATGSSALSYFMTAPRTAQALARDSILPKILSWLAKDFTKKGQEPRWATVATFGIAMGIIWAGDINIATLIVGICFLVVYSWINFAAFLERISGNPSFRPTSKGHWLISLYGFVMCIVVVSLFNLAVGAAVLGLQLVIFALLLIFKTKNRLEGVWWGLLFNLLNWGFKRMQRIIQGTKNWRPILSIFCMADQNDESQTTLDMGRRISNFQGLTMVNILKPKKFDGPIPFFIPENAQIIEGATNNFNQYILAALQAAAPGGFSSNTILLPSDARINNIDTIEQIINMDKNVLLYKHGKIQKSSEPRIDLWWKGEENGNLMALLSYIINRGDIKQGEKPKKIRLIRKLFTNENKESAEKELNQLLYNSRLKGDILILEKDSEPIHNSINEHSRDAFLIMMGLPGQRAQGLSRIFSLDKLFFTRQLELFKELPPVLYVKAHRVMELFE
ncbi:MAG: amino acid permease [Spirochaetales bacterium]|nr:amino acid permease [Spirochaetales bacterium]